MPPTGARVGGVLRFAPFGVPGGSAGQDDDRGVLVGLGRGLLATALDQVGERLVVAARLLVAVRVDAERPQLAQLRLRFADGLGVLVVVDDDLGALALRDLFDLRPGELAVEQDDAGADPSRAVVGDHEPAVVAGQDRDAVTALHALLDQAVGHRVGGFVELPVAELAVFVDQRRAVGGAPGVVRRQHAELAPLGDVGRHRRRSSAAAPAGTRPIRRFCARSAIRPHRVRRTAGALTRLGRAGQEG